METGTNWTTFLARVYAWTLVSQRIPLGIPPLLCTFEKPSVQPGYRKNESNVKELWFLFPCAGKTMDQLLETDPQQHKAVGGISETWLLTECSRMVRSVATIEEVSRIRTPHLPKLRLLQCQRLYLKSFWWFSMSENQGGSLVLNHYALDEYVPGTDPYPMLDIPRYQRRDRRNVWSLAVIWLELLTWFLLGPAGRQRFTQDCCRSIPSYRRYYEKVEGRYRQTYRVKPEVSKWIHELKIHGDCTRQMVTLLELIEREMLVADLASRASLSRIDKALQQLLPS